MSRLQGSYSAVLVAWHALALSYPVYFLDYDEYWLYISTIFKTYTHEPSDFIQYIFVIAFFEFWPIHKKQCWRLTVLYNTQVKTQWSRSHKHYQFDKYGDAKLFFRDGFLFLDAAILYFWSTSFPEPS